MCVCVCVCVSHTCISRSCTLHSYATHKLDIDNSGILHLLAASDSLILQPRCFLEVLFQLLDFLLMKSHRFMAHVHLLFSPRQRLTHSLHLFPQRLLPHHHQLRRSQLLCRRRRRRLLRRCCYLIRCLSWWKFSKVSFPFNLLYEMTIALPFENFHLPLERRRTSPHRHPAEF